jgi:hypothetical protein
MVKSDASSRTGQPFFDVAFFQVRVPAEAVVAPLRFTSVTAAATPDVVAVNRRRDRPVGLMTEFPF